MTWSYLPHTAEDRAEMLAAIGVKSAEELICRPACQYPSAKRFKPACAFKRGRSSQKICQTGGS
jgi:glycine cleavage system pyridoxal-binding protein P